MEPWQEPIRGAVPSAATFALSGLEQLRGMGAGFWPALPNFELLGLRATQLHHGSLVATMPVSPWLCHPDGAVDVGLLAGHMTMGAVWTTLEPRQRAEPIQLTYSPVRRVDLEGQNLIGRASVRRSSPFWAYADGTLEDSHGRIVANVSGHYRIRDVAFTVPDEPPSPTASGQAGSAAVDPHGRALSADHYAAFSRFGDHGGTEALAAICEGRAPRGPVHELLGMYCTAVRPDGYEAELVTTEWSAGLDGTVAPGVLAAFIGDCCGAGTWTVVGSDHQLATLQVSASLAAAVPADGRRLRGDARAHWVGSDVVDATMRLWDGDELIGSAAMTSLIRPRPSAPRQVTTRVLTTVMFTDIVDSTVRAEELGDSRWRDVLEAHGAVLRREVARCRGRLVKSMGDGVLATFDSAGHALECARALGREAPRLGVELRIGLHTGDVEVDGGDISGMAVHVAARVQAAARPGEVWVSETFKMLASGTAELLRDEGPHQLKGVEEPMRLFSLTGERE